MAGEMQIGIRIGGPVGGLVGGVVVALAWALATPAMAAVLDWHDPTPFRRDRLSEREEPRGDMWFLHRLSYQPAPILDDRRRLRGNGIAGSAGSVSSDRLSVSARGRFDIDLDGPFAAGYQFRRDEDLDGRFDRHLIHTSAIYHGWRLRLGGDVVGAKENVDLQLAVGRGDPDDDGSFARVELVLVDAYFNDKQLRGRYRRQPWTTFAHGRWQIHRNWAVHGFVNLNAPMTLDRYDNGIRATDYEYSAGLALNWQPATGWTLAVAAEVLHGSRHQRAVEGLADIEETLRRRLSLPSVLGGFDARPPLQQRLTRRFASATAELRQKREDGEERWLGFHFLGLDEHDRRPSDDFAGSLHQRREYTLYGGWRVGVYHRTAVVPTLYLAWQDIETVYPSPLHGNDQHTQGFAGKLGLGVEITILKRTGATLLINPTARLHSFGFGGGNIQVHLPF